MENAQGPTPETLQPRSNDAAAAAQPSPTPPQNQSKKPRRRSYRPSHKATFIGIAVVAVILAINAVILQVVLKKQAKINDLVSSGQVTISSAELSKLGVNRSSIGSSGTELIVTPDAQFKGKLSVAGSATIGGQLILNDKLNATSASLTQLQAGKTALSDLNVNGDATASTLNLRKDLVVQGLTQLQGPVTLNQLLTVNNSINLSGNLSVGGVLAVNKFSVQSLIIAGHLTTSGPTPNVGRGGSALGSNGTVAISGNDAAGTVSVNTGVGATAGILANIAFHTQYADAPRVVISPIGIGANFYITNLSIGGFSIAVTSGLPPGGYRFNYIVVQ